MTKARQVQKAKRQRAQVPAVAIVGYTNAGKSTLLKALSGAEVLIQDELFATLDPAVRRMKTPSGREYTLADTVGFVRHLPHQLVEAFRSTLDEVNSADLLVHVVDGHDVDPIAQLNAVREVLGQIEATDIPELVVINKADLATPAQLARVRGGSARSVVVSAATGEGIDEVAEAIADMLPHPDIPMSLLVPFDRGELISELHAHAEVKELSYLEGGTVVDALVPQWLAARVEEFQQ